MKKTILNTILVAFFTVTIYWMSVLVMPDSLFYVIANRFEPTFVLLGGINFIVYIIIKKGNRHKNIDAILRERNDMEYVCFVCRTVGLWSITGRSIYRILFFDYTGNIVFHLFYYFEVFGLQKKER